MGKILCDIPVSKLELLASFLEICELKGKFFIPDNMSERDFHILINSSTEETISVEISDFAKMQMAVTILKMESKLIPEDGVDEFLDLLELIEYIKVNLKQL